MARSILLVCGILSPLLYGVADGLAGSRWKEYSFRDQTISELGAIGAPSRPLFSALLVVVYALVLAFGAGVWRSARGRRPVKVAGGLIVALGVTALAIGQFVPMRPRGTEQGLSGTLHLVEGGVAMAMVLAAIGYAASTLGRPFRLYSIATIGVVLAFGAWTAFDGPELARGSPTPWLGVKERVFWYAYQLWFAVLALVLLREPAGKSDSSRRWPPSEGD